MASSRITSWQIDGETMETVKDFIFLGSKFTGDSERLYLLIYFCFKITADDDCSHEIKRRLLFGRKAMTNLESILKAETLLSQQRSV